MKKISTILAATMLAGGLCAYAEKEERKKGGPPEGRPSREELLKKFDKDGDGKLNEDERKAAMAARPKPGARPGGKPGARPGAPGGKPGAKKPKGGKKGGRKKGADSES